LTIIVRYITFSTGHPFLVLGVKLDQERLILVNFGVNEC